MVVRWNRGISGRKLRIPPRFVEKALTVLEEKGIIRDGETL